MRGTRQTREETEPRDFRQLGFPVSFVVSEGAEGSSMSPVLEAFRYEVLAPRSLECGGGCDGNRFRGFVTRWEGSANERDRREVSDWFRLRAEISEHEVGKLVEAWHGV
jgi:uncharacterized protein YggL (DUF469 family)